MLHYDAPDGFPTSTDPGPDDRGENFFAGGGVGYDTEISQTIDVESLALEIDGGVSYTLSAWLGGYYNQDDRARLVAQFLESDGTELGQAILGAVDAADRDNQTSLLYVEAAGTVPQGTRQVKVTLEAIWSGGSNDGYADNCDFALPLLLQPTAVRQNDNPLEECIGGRAPIWRGTTPAHRRRLANTNPLRV